MGDTFAVVGVILGLINLFVTLAIYAQAKGLACQLADLLGEDALSTQPGDSLQ